MFSLSFFHSSSLSIHFPSFSLSFPFILSLTLLLFFPIILSLSPSLLSFTLSFFHLISEPLYYSFMPSISSVYPFSFNLSLLYSLHPLSFVLPCHPSFFSFLHFLILFFSHFTFSLSLSSLPLSLFSVSFFHPAFFLTAIFQPNFFPPLPSSPHICLYFSLLRTLAFFLLGSFIPSSKLSIYRISLVLHHFFFFLHPSVHLFFQNTFCFSLICSHFSYAFSPALPSLSLCIPCSLLFFLFYFHPLLLLAPSLALM